MWNGCIWQLHKKDLDIPRSAGSTAVLDTIAALLASFAIMPAVFAFGLDPAAGPPLLFITIPTIFKAIPGGQMLMILFFLSILFAVISSSINMLEGPVESFMTQTKLSRKTSTILISIVTFILSIPLNLNMNLFNTFADAITIVVSPLAALLVFIVFYYMYSKEQVLEEINRGTKKELGNKFFMFAKYGFIIVTVLVIVLGIIYGGI
jgi:NSS family neurotransmitter:Na+ symporter